MTKKILFPVFSICLAGAIQAQNPIDAYLTGTPTYATIGTSTNKLNNPRDLDFHPTRNELWVLNRGTSTSATATGGSMVIFQNPGETNQKSKYKYDKNASHFMNYSNALAMGEMSSVPNATANILFGISTEGTNGGDNFMGPTLWPTDTNAYCKVNQTNNLLGSHCDMLHQSPKSAGIAHEKANIYFIADGNKGNIVKYDFAVPHGYGQDDHSDGKVYRYAEVKFTYKSGVPSHMVLDKATGWLYIADTGGKKIIRMQTTSGTASGNLTATNEPLALYKSMTGVTQEVFVSTGLTEPCGIDFSNGRLIVSDHANGDIIIYNATGATGVELGRIKTASTGIMGVKIASNGKIWYVDNVANKVVRVDAGSTTAVNDPTIDNTFNVYPNPATDHANIDFQLKENQNATIRICDSQGKTIDLISTASNAGENHIRLNIADKYASGIYIVKMDVGGSNYYRKLLVH